MARPARARRTAAPRAASRRPGGDRDPGRPRPRRRRWAAARCGQCGERGRCDRHEQSGPVRWAALVAARGLHNGSCLVVNAGTATTVDMLAEDGTFLGGAILPGVELMRFVLHEHTGRLPIQEGNYRDTPRNTVDAIETGCPHAQAGAIERMYRAFRELESSPLCLVSRRAGPSLTDHLAAPGRPSRHLVLAGLSRTPLREPKVAQGSPPPEVGARRRWYSFS